MSGRQPPGVPGPGGGADAAVRIAPAGPVEVLAPGPFATVQDGGRTGRAELGVGAAGAADASSLAAANRLVGNHAGAAGVEATLGGLVVRAHGPVIAAVAGPEVRVEVDGAPAGSHCRIALHPGSVLAIGPPAAGVRSYLAVRGGITAVERGGAEHREELGSMSTDTLSGLGPPPLRAGDVLTVGRRALPLPAADLIPQGVGASRPGAPLRIVWGPRDDWFTAEARRRLVTLAWTVTADADRIGLHLGAERGLDRARDGELASEPMVAGALQVPPGGRPVLFLADHPVTGGYPVIAVLARADLDAAAQLRPGDTVRFHE